jgi:hypothetical protein
VAVDHLQRGSHHAGELASFPVFGIFDGELVAFDAHGNPDFPLVCVDEMPASAAARVRFGDLLARAGAA